VGLAEGGISFRTYFVDGELPGDVRNDFLERLRARRFRPLTLESEEDQTIGWVPIHNILATQFNWPEIYVDGHLVLAMRIDRWALPPLLLKAAVRQAEETVKRDQQRDFLSRTERGEIVDRERARLKRLTLPAARAIDMAWSLDGGTLRLGSLSRNINEMFAHLFELTFGMRLVPDSPYIRALHCRLDDELVGHLADVEPTRLTGGSDGPG